MKKSERKTLFYKYNGKCAYCGCDLQKGWHADHIEPIRRNWWNGTVLNPHNEVLTNYNPSCASCNINKHSDSLEVFRERIGNFVNSLNSYSVQYKIAKRYGLVEETNKKVVFYFETL